MKKFGAGKGKKSSLAASDGRTDLGRGEGGRGKIKSIVQGNERPSTLNLPRTFAPCHPVSLQKGRFVCRSIVSPPSTPHTLLDPSFSTLGFSLRLGSCCASFRFPFGVFHCRFSDLRCDVHVVVSMATIAIIIAFYIASLVHLPSPISMPYLFLSCSCCEC